MPEARRVLVVIPTLNEAGHIADVIAQITTDDPIATHCPVIVADGGSTDGTRQIVERLRTANPNLRLVDNPGRTQAAALNLVLGPPFAGAEFLIRCDAHAAYPERFVSRLAACLIARKSASVVVPMDARAGRGCFQRGLAWIADSRLGAGGSPHRGGTRSGWVDHGHHAAFRLSDFRALGGYDTAFVANEDAEYDRRAVSAGRRIWLESSIRVGYYPRRSPTALWRQYYRYGEGRAQTCLKHRRIPAPRQAIPIAHTLIFPLCLLALPLTIWTLAYLGLYLALVGGAGLWTALRHRSVCGLCAAAALAIMHFGWGLGFLVRVARSLRAVTLVPVSS